MLNSIILMGRLTKDPELRKSSNDTSITNFTLAIDNPNVDANGERGTTFIDARCFGKVAESVSLHVCKGSKVAVSGAFTSRSYLNKAGEKRVAYEIQVNSVEFLDPKPVDEPEDYDGPYDSCGSLSGEEYEDENGEVKKLQAVPPEPKFDPMTGKPLKPKAKK